MIINDNDDDNDGDNDDLPQAGETTIAVIKLTVTEKYTHEHEVYISQCKRRFNFFDNHHFLQNSSQFTDVSKDNCRDRGTFLEEKWHIIYKQPYLHWDL